jgi:hypothetical protein
MTTVNSRSQNDNSGTVDSDLGPSEPGAGRPDVIIISEPNYPSLDKAAMAAAKEIYNKCGEENWGIEYGIVVHKNENTEQYHLTSIIRGTRDEVDLGEGRALGRNGYKYVSDLHSHPVDSYIVNEPSSVDYYGTLIRNVPRYVVVNVGAHGILIKFTPPGSRRISLRKSKLFDNKVRELLGIRRYGALPVGDELFDSIQKIPRHAKNEFITEIIGKNDGQQKEKGQLQETPIGDNIILEPLEPQTILWKSAVSDARMVSNGNHDLWSRRDATNNSNLRYKERESTYDARRTVTKLGFPNDMPIIIEKAFVGFTAVSSTVYISSHVTEIGKEAFRDCIGLTDVEFNGCVNTIGEGAFRGSRNLEKITLLNNQIPPRIGPKTFEDLHPNVKFIVPIDSVEVYRNAKHWKTLGNKIGPLV